MKGVKYNKYGKYDTGYKGGYDNAYYGAGGYGPDNYAPRGYDAVGYGRPDPYARPAGYAYSGQAIAKQIHFTS